MEIVKAEVVKAPGVLFDLNRDEEDYVVYTIRPWDGGPEWRCVAIPVKS